MLDHSIPIHSPARAATSKCLTAFRCRLTRPCGGIRGNYVFYAGMEIVISVERWRFAGTDSDIA